MLSTERRHVLVLSALIGIITILHYVTSVGDFYLHEFYKALYYIPIILAAFHFGLQGGLVVSACISLLYLPHVLFQWRGNTEEFVHRLLTIVLYNVAAFIVGRLADAERWERHKYEQAANELQVSYEKLKKQSETLAEVQEQLRHSDRLSVLGELAASLAHEVRNPLGSIKGAVEILQDDYEEAHPNYKFLQILIKEVDRLNQVIEDFLSLARLRPSWVEVIHLKEAVNSVVNVVAAKARKEKIALYCHFPDEVVHIQADETRFRQMLLNLVLNSMAAMHGGGRITIDSRLINQQKENKTLELSITDTGIGIPENEIEKIFKPFYTTKEHGTGLGLPITRRIIEEYNWNLRVHSEVGKGTRITVSIALPNGQHKEAG